VTREGPCCGWIVGVVAGLLVVFAAATTAAQQAPAAGPPADSVKVFIDCMNVSCDFDFFRTEITFVDYVRDRKQADLHLLITGEETGGGGVNYTLSFLGLGRFAGIDHLLHYVSRVTNTSDETRRGLANTIKLGLVHYVAATSVASELQITRSQAKSGASTAAPAHDPWDFWYMSTNVSLYSSGEQLTNSTDVYGSLVASRVTEAWKMKLSGDFDFSRSRYTFSDGTEYVDKTRTFGVTAYAVKSLTPHWSAGARVQASRSTYYNRRLLLSAAPAVEYNLFPYSESTRRQFTFNYGVGVTHLRYDEVTIFDKIQETLPMQSFLLAATFKQPWGSWYSSFEAKQYLTDLSKNRLILWNSLNLRVFKGFSVRFSGDLERVHDQIYLPKGGATPEEILVRRSQLATSYSYYLSFGLSYSFGSIHNNIVNTRFDSSY
jgi:hypothetical protein